MGSENSTDSVSFASSMAYRLKAGLRKVGRAIVLMTERLTGKPISRETKKRLAMSATRRDTFVWEVVRKDAVVAEQELPRNFVHVEEKVQETAPAAEAEEFPEEPIVEKVYRTPASSMVSATSSGAMMYEFSSRHFDLDSFSEESEEIEAFEPDVVEAPVFRENVEAEDIDFEDIYENLEVEAVLNYMDTIDLYHAVKEETAVEEVTSAPVLALAAPYSPIVGYLEAPYSPIVGYLEAPSAAPAEETVEEIAVEAPAEHIETEEEKKFFESVYEDLTVFAVLDYMDTIELYAKPAPEYVISEIDVPEECITTIDIEPKFVPDYVISEIASPEECETTVTIEAEEPAPVKQSILAQFVFGFDAPVTSKKGPTKVRFVMGAEEESDDEVDSVHVMTYSGDAAVSAQSMSNGPLAL